MRENNGVVLACVHTLVCPWIPGVSSSGFSCVALGAEFMRFARSVCCIVHCCALFYEK
jgi:hypothetical protein